MSRPKTTSGYPQVFFEIIEKVSSGTKPLELTCNTDKEAKAQRFRFYDFMKACRKSDDPRDKEVGEMGAGLLFSIHGSILTIQVRDHTEEADNLTDALSKWDNTEHSSPAVGGMEVHSEPPVLEAPNISHQAIVPVEDAHESLIEDFMKEE